MVDRPDLARGLISAGNSGLQAGAGAGAACRLRFCLPTPEVVVRFWRFRALSQAIGARIVAPAFRLIILMMRHPCILLFSEGRLAIANGPWAGIGHREAVILVPTRNRAGWNAMYRGVEI